MTICSLRVLMCRAGALTCARRAQAEEFGRHFRTVMYPRYGPAGGGLLRLHSTYRHDLKIYSSDEGRVQMSAAAFTQARPFATFAACHMDACLPCMLSAASQCFVNCSGRGDAV